jgi:hypothetical protein
MATDDVTAVPAARSDFYVYILFRENGVPFYVGYGSGRRWLVHETAARAGEKSHRDAIIRRMQARGIAVPKIKLHEGLTKAAAKAYEVALIAAIGRAPVGPLVNLTDGGEGASNPPPDIRVKIGTAQRGRPRSSEHAAKLSASLRGRPRTPELVEMTAAANRGRTMSLEDRARRSAALIGRPHSLARRANISAAKRGRKRARALVERTAAALRGRKRPPEVGAKISAAQRGRKLSPEAIAKRTATRQRRNNWRKHTPETRAKISATKRRNRAGRVSVAQLSLPFAEAAD